MPPEQNRINDYAHLEVGLSLVASVPENEIFGRSGRCAGTFCHRGGEDERKSNIRMTGIFHGLCHFDDPNARSNRPSQLLLGRSVAHLA